MLRIVKSMAVIAVAGLLASQAQAEGAKEGATVFQRCAICHSNTKGAPAKIGPNLFGIVGRKAGTEANFSYSAAMKASGITWTPDKLEAYVQHPQVVVPGNRMAFAGITSKHDAEELVEYLETLK
ncbi:MAG TPA: c-type cytochrome [Rhizomicrobium sp.]|nr:c-type cytochrome [Rhizomicrobium sp.]